MRIDELIDPNSDQFLKWFQGSQVVDKKGNPLMMYHATNTGINFKTFKPMSHFGDIEAAHDIVHAKKSPKGGMRIIPVYLNIKNPMVLDDKGEQHSAWRIIRYMRKSGIIDGAMEDNIYLRWQGMSSNDYWRGGFNGAYANKSDAKTWDTEEKARMKDLVKIIRKMGYDGFNYTNTKESKGSVSWVPLTNRQVRFAI